MTLLNFTIEQITFDPFKNDVFSIVFLVLAFLLASSWQSFLVVFVHKARELVLSHDSRTFEAENANTGLRLRLSLGILCLCSISIFLFQVNRFTEVRFVPYWQLLLAVVSLHAIRLFITKFIEVLFNLKGYYTMWGESYTWIHYMMGILFFPLAILMTYSAASTFTICAHSAFVFFVLSELLLIYRLFTIFYNGIASLFYLFLYLCALEILPLLIVFKVLS